MASSKHRAAFVFGVLVGASAGVAAAFLNAPQSGRRTRDQIQQSVERIHATYMKVLGAPLPAVEVPQVR